MEKRIQDVTADLAANGRHAMERFGELSKTQLNWKPDAKSWSVAQCLDHVITTHELYFPLLARLADGSAKPSFPERFSPLSGLWGRMLLGLVSPDKVIKVKTTGIAEPSSSEIDAGIVERYDQHQQRMIEHLRRLPTSMDPKKVIITSPLMAIVTYSLDVTFSIFTFHSQRHLDQAARLLDRDGFPSS